MADDDKIEIEVTLGTGEVVKGFANIKKEAKNTAEDMDSSFDKVTKKLAGLAAAYFSFRAIKGVFSQAIKEASDQEAAINQLNSALALAGRYSAQASQSFQSFASDIQKATKLTDDAVLGYAALASTFAKTNEQAQKLTQAAIDLNAATGGKIPIEAGVKALGVSLSGTAGQLAKFIPGLKELTTEQLKAGQAIEFVTSRFSGAAANQVNTFDGRLIQLEKTFNDLLEELGNFVIKSPAVLSVFKTISEAVGNLTERISTLGKSDNDPLRPLLESAIALGQVLNFAVIGPLEQVYNVTRTVVNGIRLSIQTFVSEVSGALSYLSNLISPNSAISKNLQTFADSSREVFLGIEKDLQKSIGGTFDFSATSGIADFLTNLQDAVIQSAPLTQELQNNVGNAMDGIAAKSYSLGQTLTAIFGEGGTFSKAVKEFNKNATDNFKQIGATAFQFIGSATANAFAAFGKALATGENALQGFLNSLLASFGQAAVQLGTQFILQGTAYLFAGLPNGGALISAGAALATFGGILSGLSGSASPTATTSQAGSVTPEMGTNIDPVDDFEEKNKGTVTVNIQGDVLDSRESGLRIVELIQDSFNKDGSRLVMG